MKILFLLKFYQPFDRGGSEWSSHDLARLLIKEGHDVTILTPNYGAKREEVIEKIKIIRFPFPIKLRNRKQKIAPYWTSNIFWYVYTFIVCVYYKIRGDYEIIHAHNNEFIPAVALTGLTTRIPTVATFRDYQALCPLGFCLWTSNIACTLHSYFKNDYKFFFNNYVENKNPINFFVYLGAAIRARLSSYLVKYFAKQINEKVAVSSKVKKIFQTNNVKGLKIIYNPVIIKTSSEHRNNTVLYVGKFSPGKGINLLLEILPKLAIQLPEVTFVLIGSGNLEAIVQNFLIAHNLIHRVKITGQLPHDKTLQYVKRAQLVMVPSLWPEPLPRSVIEAILSRVPAIATNTGGISEILKDERYGIMSEANSKSFYRGVLKAYKNRLKLRANIQNDIDDLKYLYSTQTVNSYTSIYKSLLK
ncbi:MAG: glycosyltransferase family 4 protein [Patescibacteria group bacterium]